RVGTALSADWMRPFALNLSLRDLQLEVNRARGLRPWPGCGRNLRECLIDHVGRLHAIIPTRPLSAGLTRSTAYVEGYAAPPHGRASWWEPGSLDNNSVPAGGVEESRMAGK